jgi:hypothetical protein
VKLHLGTNLALCQDKPVAQRKGEGSMVQLEVQAEADFTVNSSGDFSHAEQLPQQVTFNNISNTIAIDPDNSGQVVITIAATGFTFDALTPVIPTPQEAGVSDNVEVVRDSSTQVTVRVTPTDTTIEYDFSLLTSMGAHIDPVVVCDPIPTTP